MLAGAGDLEPAATHTASPSPTPHHPTSSPSSGTASLPDHSTGGKQAVSVMPKMGRFEIGLTSIVTVIAAVPLGLAFGLRDVAPLPVLLGLVYGAFTGVAVAIAASDVAAHRSTGMLGKVGLPGPPPMAAVTLLGVDDARTHRMHGLSCAPALVEYCWGLGRPGLHGVPGLSHGAPAGSRCRVRAQKPAVLNQVACQGPQFQGLPSRVILYLWTYIYSTHTQI